MSLFDAPPVNQISFWFRGYRRRKGTNDGDRVQYHCRHTVLMNTCKELEQQINILWEITAAPEYFSTSSDCQTIETPRLCGIQNSVVENV